jgi:2-polyprenyl-6-methoxyphenol hydroxylase-like FAD-dependent oxidoreductase
MRGKHALIVGGSLGGVFAASLLRKIGWTTTVFERSKEVLASRGAGLGTTRELAETMRRAGARLDTSMAVEMTGYVWLDAAGRIVHAHARQNSSSTWSRVYLPLRETVPDAHYRPGMALERVEREGERVIAHFAGGATAEGDLLIAADGNQSTVRRQLLPEVEARYAGYIAWRGIMEERDLPASCSQAVDSARRNLRCRRDAFRELRANAKPRARTGHHGGRNWTDRAQDQSFGPIPEHCNA